MWAALWVPHGLPTRDPAPFGHPFHIGPNWASPRVGWTWVPHGTRVFYPFFKWAFSVPELGTNWVLTASFVGCFVGPTWAAHMGPSSFWPPISHRSQLGLPMCGLNMGPTWDSCVFCPFFKWAFSVLELGTNWVICGLLCGSHMGCPHRTHLLLATHFT